MSYTPLELAQAFVRTGELDDALDALNQHLTDHPQDEDSRRLRVEVLARFDDPASWRLAIRDLDALSTPTPYDSLRRCALHERLNQPDDALQVIIAARRINPTDERLLERHIGLLRGRGQFADALRALERAPQDWRWWQWRGDLYADQGAHPQAADAYTRALDQLTPRTQDMQTHWADGLRARLLATRGGAYERQGLYLQADADYQAAQSLVQDDPLLWFNRGRVACAMGDTERARVLCQQAYDSANASAQGVIRQEIGRSACLRRLGLMV